MHKLKTIRFYGLSLFILPMLSVFAGPPDPPQEDVLRPAIRRPAYGFLAGGNAVFSSGNLVTTCDCVYESGMGFGAAAGGFFELPIVDEVTLIAQVLFDLQNASYTDTEERFEYVDDGDFYLLEFEKTADVALTYIDVEVLAKWNIGGKQLYFLAGPSIGTLISSNLYEKERISTPGYTFTETGTNEKVYVDDKSLDEMYEVNQFRFALRMGVGYEIPVSPQMIISPEITYALPFTTLVNGFKSNTAPGSESVSDWKHSSILAGVRFVWWL